MTQTATPPFFTQPITGPRQLVDFLSPDLKINPKNALLEIWLDSRSQCFKFEIHDCPDFSLEESVFENIVEIGSESLNNSLILMVTFANDFAERHDLPARATTLVENLHSRLETHNIKLLDALLCTTERWWSSMCSSENCCPTTGRKIESVQSDEAGKQNVRESWRQVSEIIERHEAGAPPQEFDTVSNLVENLSDDITFRDCILAHCASTPEIRSAWEVYFKQMAELSRFHKAMISTVLAAIAYLNNDLKSSAENLKISFERDPHYSLARLLRQGLTTNAPASLLVSAFSVHTPEQLIAKSEK